MFVGVMPMVILHTESVRQTSCSSSLQIVAIKAMSSNWSIDPSLCSMVAVGAALYFFSKKRKTEEEQHQQQATKKVSAGADTCAEVTASPRRYTVGEAHPFSSKQEFKGCVYLDYNATTPVFPEVITAMMPFLTNCFGNPSSLHIFSTPCRQALQTARSNVGALVNAKNPASEIYFTSCGTESDNRAVDIALHHFAMHRKRLATVQGTDNTPDTLPHVITCKTEHPAVICYLRVLVQEQRIRMTVLPVNAEGFVSVTDVQKALTPHTALVTIMHSNNEVGTVQPIREIGLCVKQYNAQMKGLAAVLFHSDGAQSLGKLLVDVQACELDMFTIVGHKYGAPKGVAALYIRTGVEAPAMLVGGGQERGIRSGTENVALAAGLGEASRLALEESGALVLHLLGLKHRLISALLDGFSAEQIEKVRFNGPVRASNSKDLLADLKIIRVMIKSDVTNGAQSQGQGQQSLSQSAAVKSAMTLEVLQQLPNTVSVSFKGIRSYEIIDSLSEKVACSAGSACHAVHIAADADGHSAAPQVKMSDVLLAMGVPEEFGFGTLRLSLGRHSTEADVDTAAAHIVAAIRAAWDRK